MAGVVGAGLLFGAMSLGGARLDAAATHESFSVKVGPRTHAVRVLIAKDGADGAVKQWRGTIDPPPLARRVEVRSPTGSVVEHDAEDPVRVVDFTHAGPGYATVDLAATWRGQRVERVVDTALIGPFAHRVTDLGQAQCDMAVAVSAKTIDRLLMPPIRQQILAGASAHAFMGEETTLERASLDLLDGEARFDLVVQGANRLEVRLRVRVSVVRDRIFAIELAELEHVAFDGEVRKLATGGAAAVGAAVTGPFAPVGAFVGWHLADSYVTKRARREIENLLETELAKSSSFSLFPETIELLPGERRSGVHLTFCEDVQLRPDGIAGALSIVPTSFGVDANWPLPGPVRIGARPTRKPLRKDEDVRIELTIDLANALLEGWSANGLLMDLLDRTGVVGKADAELQAWTTLSLTQLEPRLPPVLAPGGGPDSGWSVTLGGVALGLKGFAMKSPDERLVAGARGSVAPTWDPAAKRLELAIGLDDLWVTCMWGGADSTTLRPCLGALLRAGDVQQRIDSSLASGLRSMPSLALGDLAQEKLGLDVSQLQLTRPRPELLRLSASFAAGAVGHPIAPDDAQGEPI
jgi:hypothetical protein